MRKITETAFRYSKAEQMEIVMVNQQQALTRFANNYIHQNVKESNTTFSVRVAIGKKLGFASTNSLDSSRIKATVERAEEIARFQPENPYFVSFPEVEQKSYKRIDTFVKRTAEFSHGDRAHAVSAIVAVAKEHSLTGFGSISSGTADVCISNSCGTFAYAQCDDAFCNIVMTGDNSTGYAQAGRRDVEDIDFTALAQTAAQKALASANPGHMPVGRHTTIFEHLAAAEFMDYLGDYAFNGNLYEEGRSYLKGRLNTKIVDEKITIVDNPFTPSGFAFPFDFEGVPKKRLMLIDKGIAKNIVYDTLTASRAQKKSTGHALPAPNPFGPIPMHMVMHGGNKSLSTMIQETERGILVTRFHYTNVIDPYRLTFTGMTRDGTFLIEHGVVTRGIKNLRFTENIFECLNRIADVSRETKLIADEPGYGSRFATGTIVSALKINDFKFTSATEF